VAAQSAWKNDHFVHIGPMSSVDQVVHPTRVALLSAASASGTSETLPASGEESVLAHQIAALRSVGLRKFMIEVETVPGALLAMADRLIKAGNSVDFVRSAQDLQSKLHGSDILVIQAEGIYVAPQLLGSLIEQPGAFIITVDGRAENATFERMDLNTRWAGLGVMPSSVVAKVGELPEGWSITSSLLRQAMQDNIAQLPLKQGHLQDGDLRRVDLAADVEKLTSDIMARRAAREPGFIEARIFAPVATKLATMLWPIPARAALSDGATMLLGAASAALAGLGWVTVAAVTAITAMLANAVRLALGNVEQKQRGLDFVEAAMWLLLAIALMLASSADAYLPGDGLFAAGVVAGLALLSRQLRLPDWGKKILQSPALIALTLLLAALVGGIVLAAKTVALFQLALVIVAKWDHKTRS
jgi:hypothetical protein